MGKAPTIYVSFMPCDGAMVEREAFIMRRGLPQYVASVVAPASVPLHIVELSIRIREFAADGTYIGETVPVSWGYPQ